MAPQQPPTPSLADTVNKDMWAGPPMPLQYTSPVAVYQQRNLPLNLVALILEYVCWTLSSCASSSQLAPVPLRTAGASGQSTPTRPGKLR